MAEAVGKLKELAKAVEERKPVRYCIHIKNGAWKRFADGVWCRDEKQVAGVRCDVKKTESAGSPLQGVIEVEIKEMHFTADPEGTYEKSRHAKIEPHGTFFLTQAEAMAETRQVARTDRRTKEYFWHEGQWVEKESSNNWPFSDKDYGRDVAKPDPDYLIVPY
jgi:hypothetical protein